MIGCIIIIIICSFVRSYALVQAVVERNQKYRSIVSTVVIRTKDPARRIPMPTTFPVSI